MQDRYEYGLPTLEIKNYEGHEIIYHIACFCNIVTSAGRWEWKTIRLAVTRILAGKLRTTHYFGGKAIFWREVVCLRRRAGAAKHTHRWRADDVSINT